MKLLKLALVAALVAFVGNVFSQELIPNKHPKSQFDVNYTTTQQEATYNGGVVAMVNYVTTNIALPEEKAGRKADVLVRIVVDTAGSVSEVVLLTSVNDKVDKAIEDVLKGMPKWTPAKVNGEAVESEQLISFEVKY